MPVVIRGLSEFRAGLRAADRRLPKALQKANKQVSERIADKGRPAVKHLPSPGGSKAQSGIRPRARQNRATIALLGSNPTVHANVLGTKTHMVFGVRKEGRGPWLPWVGTSWKPEDLHGLGPVIKEEVDGFALDEYLDAILDALAPAFPD